MKGKNETPPNVLVVENNFDDMIRCIRLILAAAPGTGVKESGNSESALKILSMQHFDAVFISLNLPESGGFDIAKGLRSMAGYAITPIIFMGRQKEIQFDIFHRFHAYDYINKPLKSEEFHKTMLGLFKGLREHQGYRRTNAVDKDRVIIVGMPGEKLLIHLHDLHFAEINGRLLTLYTKHGTVGGIRMKLNTFIQYVDDPRFVRCHKSFAVNTENIAGFKYVEPRIKAVRFISETTQECLLSKTFFDSVLERAVKGQDDGECKGEEGTLGSGVDDKNDI